jgi:hypothetical protein
MKEWISSHNREEINEGIAYLAEVATEGSRGKEVLRRLVEAEQLLYLPEEHSQELRRFFAYTAKEGLWDRKLDAENPRIANALIRYFILGQTQRAVGNELGVSGKTANGWIDRGMDLLWESVQQESSAELPDGRDAVFNKALLDESRMKRKDAWKHDAVRKAAMVQKLSGRQLSEGSRAAMSQTRRARGDEWSEYGRRGGIASGETRKAKRDQREVVGS